MDYSKEILLETGLVGFGIFIIIWYFVKLISCMMIAGLISMELGLSGYYWWFNSIIIYCILGKIVFLGNSSNSYKKLLEEYTDYVNKEK